jgi:hypothetical protein
MHDSGGVSARKRFSHLSGKGDRLGERKANAGCQKLTETATRHEFHSDEDVIVSFFDRVEMDDVGMVQGGCGSGLAQNVRPTIPRFAEFTAEKLDRDPAIEFRVLGHIHVAHSAASELLQHLVMAESVADE